MYILSFFLMQAPVMSYNPPPADEWQQSIVFRCGNTTLRIEGFAPAKPTDRAALYVNGQPLKSKSADALQRDLSSLTAVYRLGAKCPKGDGAINLFISTGEKLVSGSMIFKSGVAFIRDGDVKQYRILEQVDAEAFWFR